MYYISRIEKHGEFIKVIYLSLTGERYELSFRDGQNVIPLGTEQDLFEHEMEQVAIRNKKIL